MQCKIICFVFLGILDKFSFRKLGMKINKYYLFWFLIFWNFFLHVPLNIDVTGFGKGRLNNITWYPTHTHKKMLFGWFICLVYTWSRWGDRPLEVQPKWFFCFFAWIIEPTRKLFFPFREIRYTTSDLLSTN